MLVFSDLPEMGATLALVHSHQVSGGVGGCWAVVG